MCIAINVLIIKAFLNSYTVVQKQSTSVIKVGMAHPWLLTFMNIRLQASVQINKVLLSKQTRRFVLVIRIYACQSRD